MHNSDAKYSGKIFLAAPELARHAPEADKMADFSQAVESPPWSNENSVGLSFIVTKLGQALVAVVVGALQL